MNVYNLRIGTRLLIESSLLLLLLVIITLIGISNLSSLNDTTQVLTKVDYIKIQLANKTLDNLRGSSARIFQAVLLTDAAESTKARESFQKNMDAMGDALGKLEPMLHRSEAKEFIAKIKESRTRYENSANKVYSLLAENKRDEAMALALGESYVNLHAFADNLRELIDFQTRVFDENAIRSEQNYSSSRNIILILSLITIAIGAAAALWITKSITGPINQAVTIAQTIASGDLTTHIVSDYQDETGQLMGALRNMNDSLVGIVSEVRKGTETIMTASAEISSGNMDLSSRTEAQAGALEETASSMEELTSTVKQNADNARQANKLAQQASDIASRGGDVVSRVVTTMSAINDSSKKIVDIISVIDGIAFQTNILALNAAVEAARAGEQGRGFAVVASEVRNLAQRSAAAAKEIKELINDSVDKVEIGSKQVNEAGATMDNVVTSIKQVTDIMGEITSASQEQSQGIDQINTAIVEMDNVTQQNAALVEQAAAAASSMQDQSQNLMHVVDVFKINSGSGAILKKPRSNVAPLRAAPKVVKTVPKSAQITEKKPAAPMLKQQSGDNTSDQGWEEF